MTDPAPVLAVEVDIVARLRVQAEISLNDANAWRSPYNPVFEDAANEIERLRRAPDPVRGELVEALKGDDLLLLAMLKRCRHQDQSENARKLREWADWLSNGFGKVLERNMVPDLLSAAAEIEIAHALTKCKAEGHAAELPALLGRTSNPVVKEE